MESSFTFIHIEASSTKGPAFPVEVYWGTIPVDEGVGYLVNPQGIGKWAKWDAEFLSLHMITADDLQRYGSHPSVICDAISQALAGKTVYSKAPEHTLNLLAELFAVVGRPRCVMTVLDLEELFLEKLSAKSGTVDNLEGLAEIKQEVAEAHSIYLSGGAFEGLYYSEIWKRVSSDSRACW